MWFRFFVLVFLSGRFCKDVMEFYVFAGVNAWFVVDFLCFKDWFLMKHLQFIYVILLGVCMSAGIWCIGWGGCMICLWLQWNYCLCVCKRSLFILMKKRWIFCSIPSHICCNFGICLIGSVLGWVFSMNMCWNLMCLQYRKCDLFVTFVKFLLL